MFGRLTDGMASRLWLTLFWLCLGVSLPSLAAKAAEQAAPAWHIAQSVTNLNGTTTVLWVKAGSYDSYNAYSGDTASVWTLDASGHQTSISPTYGPYTGWQISQLSPNYDGTLLLAWTNDATAADYSIWEQLSLWKLDARGSRTSISPTYGPYSGWLFHAISPQPNGTASVYWTMEGVTNSAGNYSGDALSIWTVDGINRLTAISPMYGPYAGWQFRDATPSIYTRDGSSFLLWVQEGSASSDASNAYSGDQVSIWKTDEFGNRTSLSPTYGPYIGWRASSLVPAYDGSARILWGNYLSDPEGNVLTQVSLWALDSLGRQTSVSPTYGPYPGWSPESLYVVPDNTSRLLWVNPGTTGADGTYSGDQASLWSLDAAGNQTSISPTYGPAPGWSVLYEPAWDGTEKFLWEETDPNDPTVLPSSLSLWTLDSTSRVTVTGPDYGPYF